MDFFLFLRFFLVAKPTFKTLETSWEMYLRWVIKKKNSNQKGYKKRRLVSEYHGFLNKEEKCNEKKFKTKEAFVYFIRAYHFVQELGLFIQRIIIQGY